MKMLRRLLGLLLVSVGIFQQEFFPSRASDLYDEYIEEGKNFSTWLCQESWTCTNDDPMTSDLCYCDESCKYFDDCCGDATVNATEAFFYDVSCAYVPAVNLKSMIFWIDFCPNISGVGLRLRDSCENPDENDIFQKTPVSGMESQLLYRNMYCAVCHSEEYILWKPVLDCGWRNKYLGTYDVQELLQSDMCVIRYDPPNRDLRSRECFPVEDQCPDDVTDNGCRESPRALVFGDKVYKNELCALCHEGYNENLTCIPNYDHFIKNRQEKRKNYNYSFRLLVDFNALSSRTTITEKRSYEENEEDMSSSCPEKMIYDPFSQTCREVFCDFPFSYQDGKCKALKTASSIKSQVPLMLNESSHLPCPHVKLNKSEFTITNDSQVQVLATGEVHKESAVFIGHDYALVCIRVSDEGRMVQDKIVLIFTSAESILSLICESLSIICLFIGVIVYICIPNLRNIPGRNLLCLMACLLLGQTLFISAPLAVGQDEVCVVIAVLIHYSFLGSFFWMNVMAVDMFLTFSHGFMASRGETNKHGRRFLYYCLYAFLTPLMILATAVTLEFGTSLDARPQYGRIICWFGSGLGLMYFFLIPLFLLLFVNIICFVATARSIYTTDKNSSRVLRRKNGCKLLIYIKLSVVMGLTWVFAGIALFANVSVLWTLFVIFNGLQGVLIFASFVCSRKIYRILNKNYERLSSTTRSFFSRYTGSSQSSETGKTNLSLVTGSASKQSESSL